VLSSQGRSNELRGLEEGPKVFFPPAGFDVVDSVRFDSGRTTLIQFATSFWWSDRPWPEREIDWDSPQLKQLLDALPPGDVDFLVVRGEIRSGEPTPARLVLRERGIRPSRVKVKEGFWVGAGDLPGDL
jgi:hypothetical protein